MTENGTGAPSPKYKKEVTALDKRAQSYAKQVNAADKVVCAFDYFAGAREEQILLLEWKSAKEVPDSDRQVLTKDKDGCYRVAYCDGGRWSEEGVEKWREIKELESLEFV